MNQDEALSQKYLQRVTDGAGLLLPPTEGDEFLRDAGDVFPLRLRQELSEFHSLSRSTEEALVDVYDMREHEEREPLQTIFESFCRPLSRRKFDGSSNQRICKIASPMAKR